jgi:hypothetical protein
MRERDLVAPAPASTRTQTQTPTPPPATLVIPATQLPFQEVPAAKYGPQLETDSSQQTADDQWRLKEKQLQPQTSATASSTNAAENNDRSAASAAPDAGARPIRGDDAPSEKLRFSLRIVPTHSVRPQLQPAPPPNTTARIMSWLMGAKP